MKLLKRKLITKRSSSFSPSKLLDDFLKSKTLKKKTGKNNGKNAENVEIHLERVECFTIANPSRCRVFHSLIKRWHCVCEKCNQKFVDSRVAVDLTFEVDVSALIYIFFLCIFLSRWPIRLST